MGTESFGERVARLRKEKEMTQAQMAAVLHVTDKAVSKWERNQAYPDITSLPALAELLGVSIDTLLVKTQRETNPSSLTRGVGVALAIAAIASSAFLLLVARINHVEWLIDCTAILVIGGSIWSFQKRNWKDSFLDKALKILIVAAGILLIAWARLGEQGGFYDMAGIGISLLGARLLCLT